MTDRNTGGLGAQVDLAPPLISERQTGALAVQFDYLYPSGRALGQLSASVDIVPVHPSGWLGAIGLMVEYVASLVPTTAARWSGSVFQMGTASPLVYWSSGTFQSSGSTPVNWQTDHFAP